MSFMFNLILILIFEIKLLQFTNKKSNNFLNKRYLLPLDHSFINSQLSYFILNWCYGNKTVVKRLQQLCYKFVKLVLSVNSSSTVCDIIKENKLLTIH